MDLAVLSKDHAVTVASYGDTLTGIRYTTLKDATSHAEAAINLSCRRGCVRIHESPPHSFSTSPEFGLPSWMNFDEIATAFPLLL